MMKICTLGALALALAGCAADAPKQASPSAHEGHAPAADAAAPGKGGGAMGMMAEMCQKHAAAPGRAASGPGMMDKHCQAKAGAAASAAH